MEGGASFGYWVRRRRKALDLTQDALARQVGCAETTIRKIEADARRPSRQVAERLAECLAIPLAERGAFLRAARADLAADRLPTPTFGPARPPAHPLALKPPSAHRQNLPAPPNPLIGRHDELAALAALLRDPTCRLITIVGPPGVGKTRLALAAAAAHAHVVDRVCFVPLETLTEPGQVLPAIAAALRVRAPSERVLSAVLQEELAGRRLLLVLDNCEHLLGAAPDVASLLAVCPDLHILATSRAPLRIRAEHCVTLEPLAVPDLDALPNLAALAAIPAIALFDERARAILPTFALTPKNAGLVAAICVRLDGLPLAIELAAAHVHSLSLTHIVEGLDQRLTLLVDGPRDLPLRQQTLRAAIAWSYALLAPDEQALFRRLAVFVGGATVAAAAWVCRAGEPESWVHLRLMRLVAWGLLRADVVGDTLRCSMLDTIRAFADEQLNTAQERQHFRERHARYIADLVEGASRSFFGQEFMRGAQLLISEDGNIRTALNWALEHGAGEVLLALAASPSWGATGNLSEGRIWLEHALPYRAAAAPEVQLRALTFAAVLAWVQGRLIDARELHRSGLELVELVTDEQLIAYTWSSAAIGDALAGSIWTARQRGREGLRRYRAIRDPRGEALALSVLGIVQFMRGHYAQAMPFLIRSLRQIVAAGEVMGQVWAQGYLAESVMVRGELRWARELLECNLELCQTIGFRARLAPTYASLGRLALLEDDAAEAAAYFHKGFALAQLTEDQLTQAHSSAGLARVLAISGAHERAAELLSAAEHILAQLGAVLDPAERAAHAWCKEELRCALGNGAFAAAWGHGQALHLGEAMQQTTNHILLGGRE